ncbi:MAG: transposase [Planctomycetes bacterium]|nr:transposase [Planctomycetota bacterium]
MTNTKRERHASLLDDGRVMYRLRRPFRDGTEAIVFDPLTFLERLAALIPRPRVPRITSRRPRPLRRVAIPSFPLRRNLPNPATTTRSTNPTPRKAPLPEGRRFSWPQLRARVFEIDGLRCPCGAPT